MERRRATLRDLARAAGVSLSQASHALAGYADVSAETRAKVLRLAAEIGYQPSARARSFKAGARSQQRAGIVVVGSSASTFGRFHLYGAVLAGFMAHAQAEGMDVHMIALPVEVLAATGGIAGALHRLCAEDRADGFALLTFAPLAKPDLEPLERAGLPFVLVNRHFGARAAHAVVVDYAAGVADAVRRLAALGHRRLALLVPDRDRSTIRDRVRGWNVGVRRARLAAASAPVVRYDESDEHSPRDVAGPLLAATDRPTALVCHSDVAAHAVLVAATAQGLRVPADLSIIGCDNVIGRYLTPPLCSYETRPHDLGAMAAARLAALMRGAPPDAPRTFIPVEFVCRETCGPAPARVSVALFLPTSAASAIV